uniref:C-C motif chemokine n=1 Tax=Panthera tigris altaica TaxID=74533 RepID=A0A8C9KEZ6_PANTA
SLQILSSQQLWLLAENPVSTSLPALSSGGPYHPAECCFNYIAQAIARHRIMGYYETSSQCSRPGVVFITKKGHSICANPSDVWVQDYIKDLEEK